MSDSKPETRRQAPQRGTHRDASVRDEALRDELRDDSLRGEPVGLTQFTLGIGDCATEFATGSVRIVGGLLTDLVGMVMAPFDRFSGTGAYTQARERRYERRYDSGVSRSIDRAMTGTLDTVGRSQERFRDAVGPIPPGEPDADEPVRPRGS